MITMGARQTMGLFVSPLNTATGLGIVAISLAMAVGQFAWGASHPIFRAIADRYGSARVVLASGILLALGSPLTQFATGELGADCDVGNRKCSGRRDGSFSILIGATAQRMPPEKRAFAAGFINAGGRFGQSLLAPLVQGLIAAFGWVSAMMAWRSSGSPTSQAVSERVRSACRCRE